MPKQATGASLRPQLDILQLDILQLDILHVVLDTVPVAELDNKKGRKCALAHTARTVRGDIDQRKVES